MSSREGGRGSEGLRHGDGDLKVFRFRRPQIVFLLRSVKRKARSMRAKVAEWLTVKGVEAASER